MIFFVTFLAKLQTILLLRFFLRRRQRAALSLSLVRSFFEVGNVLFRDDFVFDDRSRVVRTNDTLGFFLVANRTFPRRIQVFFRKVSELGDELSNERVAFGVDVERRAVWIRRGRIDAEVWRRPRSDAGESEPVEVVDGPICVEQPLFKDLRTFFPADPEIAAGEEAGNGVSGEMMQPSGVLELSHAGVDVRVAGVALSPRFEQFFVVGTPRYVEADWRTGLFGEDWAVPESEIVRHFPKEQLADERSWWFGAIRVRFDGFHELVVESTSGEAAEGKVWAQ